MSYIGMLCLNLGLSCTRKAKSPRHLKVPNAVRTGVYYGKDRNKLLTELASYDLVITTYSVVRLDWKTSLSQPSDTLTLHSARWGRIVLDEGNLAHARRA